MHTMTCVDPKWLVKTGMAMCDILDPTPDVAPSYDPATDQVLSWCHVSYGVHSWRLPMHAGGMPHYPWNCVMCQYCNL